MFSGARGAAQNRAKKDICSKSHGARSKMAIGAAISGRYAFHNRCHGALFPYAGRRSSSPDNTENMNLPQGGYGEHMYKINGGLDPTDSSSFTTPKQETSRLCPRHNVNRRARIWCQNTVRNADKLSISRRVCCDTRQGNVHECGQ